ARFGKQDRRHDYVFPGELAKALGRQSETPNGTWDAWRQTARVGEHTDNLAVASEIHFSSRRERRTFAIIERRRTAVRRSDDHESTAADVARARVSHRQREGGRDGCVDRITTTSEDRCSGIAGSGRCANDESFCAVDPEVADTGRRNREGQQANSREQLDAHRNLNRRV